MDSYLLMVRMVLIAGLGGFYVADLYRAWLKR